MSAERSGRRAPKSERDNSGINKNILVGEGVIEGVLEINVTTIDIGKELKPQKIGGYQETWHVLNGVGLFSLIESEFPENKSNVRFEKDMVARGYEGDRMGLINIGRDNLILLITKTRS